VRGCQVPPRRSEARSSSGSSTSNYQTFAWAPDAATALDQLDAAYRSWVTGVSTLDTADLDRPIGPAEGPWADGPWSSLVPHINREAIHHLAEVALLREPLRRPGPGRRRPVSAYGMQGRLRAAPGRGRELAALVLEGAGGGIAGCLLYVVGCPADDPDTVVITEVWTDQAAHDASLPTSETAPPSPRPSRGSPAHPKASTSRCWVASASTSRTVTTFRTRHDPQASASSTAATSSADGMASIEAATLVADRRNESSTSNRSTALRN